MTDYIGIRREDKNKWERRVPITPAHVKELKEHHQLQTIIQPSQIRCFSDEAYAKAGALVQEDISKAKGELDLLIDEMRSIKDIYDVISKTEEGLLAIKSKIKKQ